MRSLECSLQHSNFFPKKFQRPPTISPLETKYCPEIGVVFFHSLKSYSWLTCLISTGNVYLGFLKPKENKVFWSRAVQECKTTYGIMEVHFTGDMPFRESIDPRTSPRKIHEVVDIAQQWIEMERIIICPYLSHFFNKFISKHFFFCKIKLDVDRTTFSVLFSHQHTDTEFQFKIKNVPTFPTFLTVN